jgi:hypothetical protein
MRAVVLPGAVPVLVWITLAGSATPITFDPGGGTYTYHALSGPDPNATVTNAEWEKLIPPGGGVPNAYYFGNAGESNPGLVSYTFQAAPGQKFTGATATAVLAVLNFSGARIVENFNSDRAPDPITLDSLTGMPGVSQDTYDTVTLPVAGASSFTIWFTVASSNSRLFDEFEELPPRPFVVSTTAAIPEPGIASLLACCAAPLLLWRRAGRK